MVSWTSVKWLRCNDLSHFCLLEPSEEASVQAKQGGGRCEASESRCEGAALLVYFASDWRNLVSSMAVCGCFHPVTGGFARQEGRSREKLSTDWRNWDSGVLLSGCISPVAG